MALQLESDIEFQHRAWLVQRIGWLLMLAIVAAALLGVFGVGPLSSAKAEGGRLNLEFERFPRLGHATKLRFEFVNAPAARLELSRSYLESFRIEQITPEPREAAASQDWIAYSFAGEGPITVTLDLIPEKFGSMRGQTRGSGETLLFRQFVYP